VAFKNNIGEDSVDTGLHFIRKTRHDRVEKTRDIGILKEWMGQTLLILYTIRPLAVSD